MAAGEKKWTVVLRCHECNRRFAINKVSVERIAFIPQLSPCPHCRARSVIIPGQRLETAAKLHRIIDLRQETN